MTNHLPIFTHLRKYWMPLHWKFAKAELYLIGGCQDGWFELTYYIETLLWSLINFQKQNKKRWPVQVSTYFWVIDFCGLTPPTGHVGILSIRTPNSLNELSNWTNLSMSMQNACLKKKTETYWPTFLLQIFAYMYSMDGL